MKLTKKNFSRYNQPVTCRLCGKLTTYSEANGHHGLALCRVCFEDASMENEHFDGHHEDAPNSACKHCSAEAKTEAQKATATEAEPEDLCVICETPLDDSGEGWDDLCPGCADRVSEAMDEQRIDRDAAIEIVRAQE